MDEQTQSDLMCLYQDIAIYLIFIPDTESPPKHGFDLDNMFFERFKVLELHELVLHNTFLVLKVWKTRKLCKCQSRLFHCMIHFDKFF